MVLAVPMSVKCERPPEAWCWERLRNLRWPARVVCPRCRQKAGRHYRRRHVQYYRCARCRRMFSDRTKTPFEASRLPLACWFQAIVWLMINEPGTVRGLAQMLGVDPRTAKRMTQRLAGLDTDKLLRSIGVSVLCWKPDPKGQIGVAGDTVSDAIL